MASCENEPMDDSERYRRLTKTWSSEAFRLSTVIGDFVSSSEDEFTAFGVELQKCLIAARDLAVLASQLVETISSDKMRKALELFQTQVVSLENQFLNSRSSDYNPWLNIREGLEKGRHGIVEAQSYQEDFKRSAMNLQLLSVVARVNSVQHGADGADFVVFSKEVGTLSQKIVVQYKAAVSRTDETHHAAQAAAESVFADQAIQTAQIRAALRELRASLDVVTDLDASAAAASQAISHHST